MSDSELDMSGFLIDPAGSCGWNYPENFIESVHRTRQLTCTLSHLTDDRIPFDLSLPFSTKLWFETGLSSNASSNSTSSSNRKPLDNSATALSNAPRAASPAPGPGDVFHKKPSHVAGGLLPLYGTHDLRQVVFDGPQSVFCDVCSGSLVSGTRNGLQCSSCQLKLHDTCRASVATACRAERSPSRDVSGKRSPAPAQQLPSAESARIGAGAPSGRRPPPGLPEKRDAPSSARAAAQQNETYRSQTPSQQSVDSYASDGAGSGGSGRSQPPTPGAEPPASSRSVGQPQKPGRLYQPPGPAAPSRLGSNTSVPPGLRTLAGTLYKQPNSYIHTAWTLRYCSIDPSSREVNPLTA